MIKGLKLCLIGILMFNWLYISCQSNVNIVAHSHNDYEQDQPLTTALNLEFQSIEIDILLFKGQLIVTHNKFNLSSKPTLEELYFEPLLNLHKSKNSIKWILIDFKDYSIETLETLHKSVLKYKDLFQSRTKSRNNTQFQIILSGNIPRIEIANNPKYKYFFLDGRISDLDNPNPLQHTPLISSNITAFTTWQRNHCLKESEIKSVRSLVDEIHRRGIKLRFWNTEDNPIIWNQLIELGVDVISADDLQKFKSYLEDRD